MQLGKITIVPHRQGTPGWLEARIRADGCASEAPAMMGASPHLTRDRLLAMKAVGHQREFSDYVQKHVLDRGHEAEAAAREITEAEVGELSPVTYVREVDGMLLLASLDGITISEEEIFEHKLWNEELAAAVARGEFPADKVWQMEQQLLVSGAQRVRLVVSDGTREKRVEAFYTAQPGRAEKLVAGWKQFLLDVKAYEPPPAAAVEPVAKTIEALPALVAVVEGKVVSCNLEAFKPKALAYIASINTQLETDQHFADAEVDVRFCEESEGKLKLAVEQMLAQMGDINAIVATVNEIREAFRQKRLQLDKLVKSRKDEIRTAEVLRGRRLLSEHIAALNAQLGRPYMPLIAEDFAGAVKNKRTIESLRNAVNTHLAELKIRANEVFGTVNTNLNWLRENARDYGFLFADVAQLVVKPHEDVVQVATARIQTHKAEEDRKAEAERERIRQEEEARARAKADAEARAAAAQAAAQAAAAAAPAPTAAPAEPPAAVPAAAPSAQVVPITRGKPSLKLGQINERIAPLQVTAEGLERLGFPPAGKEGAAKMYHEADFPRMVDSMVAQLRTAQQVQLQKEAA